ncbi:helix-turn-helix transcriptional regulator [Streptomyces silvisoli]|uniref:Response regulator transcription factor n=1 Tax=Streptomyces silvisoli TaxID=3034235 RepID=A0ABT5ZNK7_9ACTN|nr:response regulator transcription factor [Streptomyces silvisoli]MDF3290588.1 response regulator transcription factor [Streptomyces silvisoli]
MQRVPVVVEADDPISAAGTAAKVREQPELELVELVAPGTVVILVTEEVDEALTARCRKLMRGHDARLVLVVSRMREAELLRVIECGVSTVLWRREATSSALLAAVQGAHRGDGAIPSDLLGRLLVQVGRMQRGLLQPQGLGYGGVSERELDVLRLIADGLDTGEIAAKLSYSERTIKNILQGLMGRLQLRNRAHAVAYALREGFI